MYTKAIELTTDNAPAKAILHANRSMCYLSMSNASSALEDANVAVSTDSTYIKGYYRQAMAHTALSNHRSAKESLVSGLKLKPDDKELKTQLDKVEAALRTAAPSPSTSTKSNTSVKTASSTSSAPAASKPAAKAPASKKATSEDNDDKDDDADLKSLNLRGYKKTSDGRTTTFFNNELDEDAKKLIGDIAPKKLDAEVIPSVVAAAPEVGSAWNSAGTYEERIVTPWVQETLTANLAAIRSTVAADKLIKIDAYTAQSVSGIDISVSATEGVTGHAQVTMMRGKKKHMCDFSADVKWVLTIHTSTGDQTVEGKLGLVDITADKEYEVSGVEVTHFNKKACTVSGLPGFAGNLFNSYIKKTDQSSGLQKQVHSVLMAFCDEFKTK